MLAGLRDGMACPTPTRPWTEGVRADRGDGQSSRRTRPCVLADLRRPR